MKPNDKPSLANVDGREPGKVQLMSIKLLDGFGESPQQMHEYFEEGKGKDDPWLQAEGLKRGIEGDWPEHYWAIVGNWRARYPAWRRHMLGMGLALSDESVSPQEYIATFK